MGKRIIGLAKETTYGTYIAPTMLIPGSLEDDFSVAFITDETPYAGRINPTPDIGRSNYRLRISNVDVRHDYVGMLLRAFCGQVTTTGTTNYTHTFKRVNDDVAAGQALTGYSVHVEVDSTRYAMTGSLLNSITFEGSSDGRLKVTSMEWIGKNVTDAPSATATAGSTANAFTFRHAAHKRALAAYSLVESVQMTFNNNIQTLNLQDGTTGLGISSLGRHEPTINLTVAGTDTQLLTDYNSGNPSAVEWDFTWTIGANNEINFNFPRAFVNRPLTPLGGFEIATKQVEMYAAYDTTDATECTITLKNQTASY